MEIRNFAIGDDTPTISPAHIPPPHRGVILTLSSAKRKNLRLSLANCESRNFPIADKPPTMLARTSGHASFSGIQ
jgi:hypothetical protein